MASIFDELTYEESPEEQSPGLLKQVGQTASHLGKSITSAFGGTYGDILSLIGLSPKENLTPGQKALYEAELKSPEHILPFLQEDDVLPRYSRLPTSEDIGNLIGEEQEPGSASGRYAKRIGRSLGGGAAFGASPSTLASLAGASSIGQSAKELGAPEGVATTLELVSMFGPQALAKHAYGSKKLKDFVNYARKQGLTEQEIAGLVQGDRKAKVLAKIAKKGGKTENILNSINEKAGSALENVKQNSSQFPMITGELSGALGDKFGEIVTDLRKTIKPSPDKQSAINFIQEAYENIMNQGATPEKLINFWQDINAAVNWNSIKGGKKVLTSLKQPIMETLTKVSPELAKDFELANTLYSRSKFLSKSLKPHMIDNVLDKGPEGAAMLAIALGDPGIISKYIGANVFRTLAREFLFNPRIQNISKKMLNAIKDNKPKTAQAFLKTFKKEIEKDGSNIFDQIESSDIF